MMIDLNTRIFEINEHVYLGEYDEKGIIGKLYNEKVYVDVFLGHKRKDKKGIQISDFKRLTKVQRITKDMFYPNLRISDSLNIGQGMIGVPVLATEKTTLRDYIDFLEKVYLRILMTKYK